MPSISKLNTKTCWLSKKITIILLLNSHPGFESGIEMV